MFSTGHPNPELQEQLQEKYMQLQQLNKDVYALLKQAGAMQVDDYTLTDPRGSQHKLSDIFGGFDQMVLVHNIGVPLPVLHHVGGRLQRHV